MIDNNYEVKFLKAYANKGVSYKSGQTAKLSEYKAAALLKAGIIELKDERLLPDLKTAQQNAFRRAKASKAMDNVADKIVKSKKSRTNKNK